MHATCEHGYEECGKGGAYLNLEEVFGWPVQLLKGLLARIWYGLHSRCGVIVCTVVCTGAFGAMRALADR